MEELTTERAENTQNSQREGKKRALRCSLSIGIKTVGVVRRNPSKVY
jgi:hypothetical protein